MTASMTTAAQNLDLVPAMYSLETDFGFDGAVGEVEGYAHGHHLQDYVPMKKAGYQFRRDLARMLFSWWDCEPSPLYVFGPMGSGKTSGLTQMAAILNVPVQLVNCHDRLETPELVGRYVIVDGDMIWTDGPLTQAMRYGQLLILDEVDLLNPGTAAGLNGLREGMPLTIPETNEVIKPHPNFRLAVTANTNGMGDMVGTYMGTNRMNQAFLDGFIGLKVDYPEKDVEMALLKDHLQIDDGALDPKIQEMLIEKMVDTANDIRSAFIGADDVDDAEAQLDVTMSTRSLCQWARWTANFAGTEDMFQRAIDVVLFNASPEAREFIHGIIQRRFGDVS